LARHFGARRKAYNWTVAILKTDIEQRHATGVETTKPSLWALRQRWNQVKSDVCVNAETGQPWWSECSKEAYADCIAGAVGAYWNWQTSRAGKRVGFPRFKKKGRDARCSHTALERVTNPRPLDAALAELRHVSRARSRCTKRFTALP
jgi:putative transposase